MELTRRNVIVLGAGIAVTMGFPLNASTESEDAIEAFTGGAEMAYAGIELTTPEIAENGNTVPVEVSAPGAAEILVIATANPLPGVAKFTFGAISASQYAKTRIRLAGTQDVIAIAKMQDGSFARTSNTVKVTIGGCGG